MELLRRLRIVKLDEIAEDRCTNCPFFYSTSDYYGEYDEGCMIKGWDYDEGYCINMFLPKWVVKFKYWLWERKDKRLHKKFRKEEEAKCRKCKANNENRCDGFCWK